MLDYELDGEGRFDPEDHAPGGGPWEAYPSADEDGFGHVKMCYFISCPESELPIRDYARMGKLEPRYEEGSYNEHSSCNQSGIRNGLDRGMSFIAFYTRYEGKEEDCQGRYFITGLFPVAARREIDGRTAYRTEDPVFLSIEDGLELNDATWQRWFDTDVPTDTRGASNLRYMAKFLEQDTLAWRDVIDHFEQRRDRNRFDDYVAEVEENRPD